MLLILHISIALSSLIYSGYIFLSPSKTKIELSYWLIAATIVTGTVLTIIKPAHILSTCISGLVYVAIATSGSLLAKHKLSKEPNS